MIKNTLNYVINVLPFNFENNSLLNVFLLIYLFEKL